MCCLPFTPCCFPLCLLPLTSSSSQQASTFADVAKRKVYSGALMFAAEAVSAWHYRGGLEVHGDLSTVEGVGCPGDPALVHVPSQASQPASAVEHVCCP